MALHPKRIDLSLGRLERLLQRLGDPHRRAPPVVHVAGTNGKGSTVAFLRAGLEADGRRVHVYTSPHLVRFHERIRLAGALIDEDKLVDLLRRCEAANRGEPITFFEITTAAAFLAFAEVDADVLLLEVGLGGRLDATNVIDHPALTMITPVSMDHAEFLGDDVATIAGEKAGILKPGVTGVVSTQTDPALRAIRVRAEAVGAPLLVSGRDWTASSDQGELLVRHGASAMRLPRPGLSGAHQMENAGAAAVALQALGCSETAIAEAMTAAVWPARLQRLSKGPLVDRAAGRAQLWLDGGHNAAAGAALARQAAEWRASDGAPLSMIVGMLNTKDPAAFLAPFAALEPTVRTIAISGEPATLTADQLAAAASKAGLSASPAQDLIHALDGLLAEAGAASRTLICGSLYLAGQVLAENG